MKQVLTDIEDRMLAMAEGEFVHFKVARPVLGTFYERNVSFAELSSIVGRLSNLGLIHWRIREGGRWCYRWRASEGLQHSCAAAFSITPAGANYLRQLRHVA
jgi:hypothetical protein